MKNAYMQGFVRSRRMAEMYLGEFDERIDQVWVYKDSLVVIGVNKTNPMQFGSGLIFLVHPKTENITNIPFPSRKAFKILDSISMNKKVIKRLALSDRG